MTNTLRDEWGPFSPRWSAKAILSIVPAENLRVASIALVEYLFDQDESTIDCEDVIQFITQMVTTGTYYREVLGADQPRTGLVGSEAPMTALTLTALGFVVQSD